MMNGNHWLRSMTVASALVLLAGCSSSHKKDTVASGAMGNGLDATQSAQTFGLADPASIQTDATGRVINPLTAPANQTYYFLFR